MTTTTADRATGGYALAQDEGEAFWLAGLLQTVKIGGADTGGRYGLSGKNSRRSIVALLTSRLHRIDLQRSQRGHQGRDQAREAAPALLLVIASLGARPS